jgi:hypothetical protein
MTLGIRALTIFSLGLLPSGGVFSDSSHVTVTSPKNSVTSDTKNNSEAPAPLPRYRSGNSSPHLATLEEAENFAKTACKNLTSEDDLRNLFFNQRFRPHISDEVNLAFPHSLMKATDRHRDHLIRCSEVKVRAGYWTRHDIPRMIDNSGSILTFLGLMAGELNFPDPGKFGGYARIETTCVERDVAQQKLLQKYLPCLQHQQNLQKLHAQKRSAEFFKTSSRILAADTGIQSMEQNEPPGCTAIRNEIESEKIPLTIFPAFDKVACEEIEDPHPLARSAKNTPALMKTPAKDNEPGK